MEGILPKSLSIVFPLFNEEERFSRGLPLIIKFYKAHQGWEFIFVNDGSSDKTKELVEEKIKNFPRMILISYRKNQGKGYALKQGILKANRNYVLFTDIDFSTPVSELKLFMPFVKRGADMIIGTRKIKGAVILKHQPKVREWLGKRFTNLTNFCLGLDVSDFTCGFKLFKTKMAKKLFTRQKIKRWGFDAEILFLAKKGNLKVVEVPVTWSNDQQTKVRLAKDVMQSLMDLFKIRLNDLSGQY
ncbi:hypothetical protein A2160_02410 [Candidatus Beckwithbacteria bacterium RBG_13_42_9]|uniref:Glycosyltransferase 2-like domain-containing protein n=1 Tax=Candidatus Beckwithbacteria bacterium RBG_13_42_9 TaxID=1797457 RepID=A0A1F5E7E1_9BACT|nr:MAG: hypothetical protein A2160_02410 [Candidatus Beckwithbacteria bacterium RBG_13_42_9]